MYWKEQKTTYPILSRCALKILRIPATSAQIEQKFSRITHQFNPQRESLKAATLAQLVQTTTSDHFVNVLKRAAGNLDERDSSSPPESSLSQSLFE